MEEVGTKQAPCSRCGELTESELGGVYICQACYEVRSSCCPEFGPDDLADTAGVTKPETGLTAKSSGSD